MKKLTYKFMRLIQVFKMPSQNRTSSVVNNEYNDRSYNTLLSKYRKNTQSIITDKLFLLYGSKKIRLVRAKKFLIMQDHEYNTFKYNELFKNVYLHRSIIEIGCGFGRNLFAIRNLGYKGDLAGIDISSNAISLAKLIDKKLNLRVNFAKVDAKKMTSYDFKELRKSKSGLVMSYQFFEQIPNDVETVLAKLVSIFSGHHFIFIESRAELTGTTLSEFITKVYIRKKNYQNSLLKNLRSLQKRGMITNLKVEKYYIHDLALLKTF